MAVFLNCAAIFDLFIFIESSRLTFYLLSILVELSFADVHVEDSTSSKLWKHCGHQASRADPPHSPPRWITHQRGLILSSECTVGLIQAVVWEGFRFKTSDSALLEQTLDLYSSQKSFFLCD